MTPEERQELRETRRKRRLAKLENRRVEILAKRKHISRNKLDTPKVNKKIKPRSIQPPWNIPKMWPDSTIFILGGGPSLNQVNFELIKDKHIIGVNNAYGDPLGDGVYNPRAWVDVCWFGDGRWWGWHKNNLKNFKGLIVSCASKSRAIKEVHWVTRGKANGIETRKNTVAWNRCSGSSAINLAYHLGAKRIILLGFDMRMIDGNKNWHNDHSDGQRANIYTRFLKSFLHIKRDADKLNLEILNATQNSAITEFPIIKLEDIV